MKKLAYAVLTTAMAGGLALSSAGVASAAHCVSSDGESPGFSRFGERASEQQTSQSTQGDGTAGASSCRDTTGSPSDRAPGKS